MNKYTFAKSIDELSLKINNKKTKNNSFFQIIHSYSSSYYSYYYSCLG